MKENYQYKVSIIVPCYNTKPWLDECLQSLVDQTLQEIEIICVNDGSTDSTGDRLDEWQAQYPNTIKVIHQVNSGLSNARNSGMAIAQGECIGFVDSDDFVDASMYEKLYKVLADNNADLVKCGIQKFTNKNKPPKKNLTNIKNLDTSNNIIYISISACDSLYKTNFLQKHNLNFVDHIYYTEDSAFSYELAIYLPKFIILNDKLYYYRQHRKGQLTSKNGKNIYCAIKVFEYLQHKIKKSNIKNLIAYNKFIIKKQVATLFTCMIQISYKYKKDFLFKASNNIFNNNKVLTIYKTMLFAKYRNIFSYFIVPIVVFVFHSCYLWQKLPFIKSRGHVSSD